MPIPAFDYRAQWSENCQGRGNSRTRLNGLHTQQGNGNAFSLANFLCNPNSGVSYHVVVDNDRNLIEIVPVNLAAWAVGAGNNFTYNLCFAGSFVEWSTDEWMSKMGNGIDIAAWWLVKKSAEAGRDPHVIGWDLISAGREGTTDHRGINEAALHASGHTDCGPNFPWSYMVERVNFYVDNGTDAAPLVNLINVCRDANTDLGDALGDEGVALDRVGRYRNYQGGTIYWHPRLGGAAFALRQSFMDKYGQNGYEGGELGYVTGPQLTILPYDRSSGLHVHGGRIATFEGGTMYLRDLNTADEKIAISKAEGVPINVLDRETQRPWIMKGTIRNLYRDLGYEGSVLGWPQSDEMDYPGGKVQLFEHGRIIWDAATNTAVAYDGLKLAPGQPPIPTPEPRPLPPFDPPQSHVGELLADYAGGVPGADALKAAGFSGAVRYVSDGRADWMKGKPIRRGEADDLRSHGMFVVSNYQYSQGGNTTSDWTVPSDGPGDAVTGLRLHAEAGGPDTAPIFVSIDANPTRAMYENKVRPYLQGWLTKLPNSRLGVYANRTVIDWLIADGIGSFYWQHNWDGINDNHPHHPAACLHQIEIDKSTAGGVKVDKNVILKNDFGQWA